MPSPVPRAWDIQADVVVVGFGAAGACAALEAASASCSVDPDGLAATLVSSLSLADCVFSGRRAGRHAARAAAAARP